MWNVNKNSTPVQPLSLFRSQCLWLSKKAVMSKGSCPHLRGCARPISSSSVRSWHGRFTVDISWASLRALDEAFSDLMVIDGRYYRTSKPCSVSLIMSTLLMTYSISCRHCPRTRGLHQRFLAPCLFLYGCIQLRRVRQPFSSTSPTATLVLVGVS